MTEESSMQAILLETERLTLRRFTEDDIEYIYELDNDPEVMRFINSGVPVSRSLIRDEILPLFTHYEPQYPGYGFWAVLEKNSKEFLGWMSFRPTGTDPLEVTLGMRFRKAAWGQGYAMEGARALLHKGFTEMGVRRVVATTYQDNLRSRRVLEKIGLRYVHKFRLTPQELQNADTFHVDTLDVWDGYDLLYALDISEWKGENKDGIHIR